MMKTNSGLTLLDGLMIVVLVVFIAVGVVVAIGGAKRPSEEVQALSKMRQLHLVTQQMWLDGTHSNNAAIGWPGDTGGSFPVWVRGMVPRYLETNDFVHLVSKPGRQVYPGALPGGNTNWILVYAAGSNSPDRTVFLSTADFVNSREGGTLAAGTERFVILRRDGEGGILPAMRAGDANLVGEFAPLCR